MAGKKAAKRVPASPGAGPSPTKLSRNPLDDLAAYPILTEEIGYPPSPLSKPSGGGQGSGRTSAGSLGQLVNQTVSNVLGWKVKAGDTKAFLGALTQSFTLTEVEGHVESAWVARTYAAQTDLDGGLSGAQASIYTRGKDVLDQALPLLDGLYSLDPEADQEDVDALKAVVKSQLTELVNELGFLSGPRVGRVNQYFGLLITDHAPSFPPKAAPNFDPDQIGGTLGNLRDVFGLNFARQDFVNSLIDEKNLSNYRILADWVTTLAQSWINNLPYFGLDSAKPFFGTQLVLLSRQLQVVAESVDELRFTLDSVFIGPAERQTIKLVYQPLIKLPAIFLEDLLSWAYNFATTEGPTLVQEGGKFAVKNTFEPVTRQLHRFFEHLPTGSTALNPMPPGLVTPRVKLSLKDLVNQLKALLNLAAPIDHQITTEPDFGLPFEVVKAGPISLLSLQGVTNKQFFVRGTGFLSTATVATSSAKLNLGQTFFRSENLLVVNLGADPGLGNYEVTVTNNDGPNAVVLKSTLVVGP